MEFRPNKQPEQTPKVTKFEKFNVTLDKQRIPVVGTHFETTIVYDNGARAQFGGTVTGSVTRGGKLFAIIVNDKNPGGIEFPIPAQLLDKTKNL